MKYLILAVTLTLASSPVLAHSKANAMMPVDGTSIVDAPENIMLNFANDIRLTKVELVFGEGEAEELDLGNQTAFAKEYTVPMTDMGTGSYLVAWRGLGNDGHPMQGEFSFVVE